MKCKNQVQALPFHQLCSFNKESNANSTLALEYQNPTVQTVRCLSNDANILLLVVHKRLALLISAAFLWLDFSETFGTSYNIF